MTQTVKKQTRNAELTKEKILDCASIEFSQKGFDGARVDAIIKRADVNISLVYHYFSGKEGLFIAVMERTYRMVRSHHKEVELRGLEPIAAMAKLVRATFRLFTKHQEIIGLLNSENLHKAKHIRKSEEIKYLFNPLLETIKGILDQGVEEKKFRRGVDPIDLFISMNAEGYFFLSNSHTLGFILHQKLLDPARIKQREDHIVDVILSYLQYQPEQG